MKNSDTLSFDQKKQQLEDRILAHLNANLEDYNIFFYETKGIDLFDIFNVETIKLYFKLPQPWLVKVRDLYLDYLLFISTSEEASSTINCGTILREIICQNLTSSQLNKFPMILNNLKKLTSTKNTDEAPAPSMKL